MPAFWGDAELPWPWCPQWGTRWDSPEAARPFLALAASVRVIMPAGCPGRAYCAVRCSCSFLTSVYTGPSYLNLPDKRYGSRPQLSEGFTVHFLCSGKGATRPALLPPGVPTEDAPWPGTACCRTGALRLGRSHRGVLLLRVQGSVLIVAQAAGVTQQRDLSGKWGVRLLTALGDSNIMGNPGFMAGKEGMEHLTYSAERQADAF